MVLVDLNDDHGQSLAKALGSKASFCKTDVSDPAAVQAAFDHAATLGEVRVAVSCAGVGWAARVLGKDGSPHKFELFRQIVDINLMGTFNMLRSAAAVMAKNELVEGERGVIVNTASVAAFEGQVGQLAYAASKGAVAAMTLPAARDLASQAIRVMTIAPGTFDTPMLAGLPERVRESLAGGIPFPPRLGNPAEYAELAFHIAQNHYLNGEVIRCDGALRMPPK